MSHPDPVARLAALARGARPVPGSAAGAVLVTVTVPAGDADPLGAMIALAEAAAGDARLGQLLDAGRMFWSAPGDSVAMSCIGAAVTLSPAGGGRFAAADERWRALLASAVVECPPSAGSAGGPILSGGFAFEDLGPRSAEWADFGSTHLFVPALRVARTPGGCWLTLTVMMGEDGLAAPGTDMLRAACDIALAARAPAEVDPEATGAASLEFADDRPAAEWRGVVAEAVRAIEAGALQKVVVARAVHAAAECDIDVMTLVATLRAVHREAYVFACWRGDAAFVGASPERLVRLAEGVVDASSLAGSAPRGATPAEDRALAGALRRSAKDLAEHALVRSALGDALEGYCEAVTSDAGPALLTLPHVHHLHTAVRARIRAGRSFLDLAGALHPTPAVGGTPRTAALAFLRAREVLDRGWYAGPVGWIGRDAGELAVGLRSALVRGASATLYAGCGIVGGSEPERELSESRIKLRPMQLALAATLAAGLRTTSQPATAERA